MRADNYQVGAGAGNFGDYGRLIEGMGELSDRDGRVRRCGALYLVEEPSSSFRAITTSVVSIVEAKELCKYDIC